MAHSAQLIPSADPPIAPPPAPASPGDAVKSVRRESRRFVRSLKAKLIVGVALAALALLLVGGSQVHLIHRLVDDNAWVSHTNEVMVQLGRTLTGFGEWKAALTDFALTGDERYIAAMQRAAQRTRESARAVERLTADNPVQQRHGLDRLMVENLALGEEIVSARRAHGFPSAASLLSSETAARGLNALREAIGLMEQEERRLLEIRDTQAQASVRHTLAATLIGSLLAVALLILGCARTWSDINKRERAETAELQQRLLLESVLDQMSDGVVVADSARRATLFNPAAMRIMGPGAPEAAIDRWPDRYGIFRTDGVTPFPAADMPLERAIRGESCDDVEMTVREPGAAEAKWIVGSARPLRGEAGESSGGVLVIRDATRIKSAEAQLRAHAEELQRSNGELEQFAYVASHDLQEPLRIVSSYTQLLGKRYRGKLDPAADDFIAFAVDGASRMQQLITDLLAYSRVGTRSGEFRPASTEAAVAKAIANLRIAIDESGTAIEHENLPVIQADPAQLAQVFQNLIGNAIKFRGAEPPAIRIRAAEDAAAWRFSVSDTGIGIDPKYSERVFQVFQRLHSRKDYSGTGIGLAICKKIVERHGGRIWFDSEPGKGTTFHFTISKRNERA